ncbi:MAG TPA: NUDIX domain-containing protein [Anaerolineales bacterium]
MKLLLRLAYRVLQLRWFLTRPVTLGVRLLPIRGDTVLLVRHSYQNAWFLPGGGVKRGETLEQAIRREAAEECGAQLEHLEILGAFTHFYEYKNDHIILFLSRDFRLAGKPDYEIEKVDFFPFDQLPEDISQGSRRRIEEYKRGALPAHGTW